MRKPAEVARVLELAAAGWSTGNIVRATGVPRNTVRRWTAGRVPKRPPPIADPAAHVGPVADAYAYLLGLYLGDGHVAKHPRGVLRLVIYLDASYPRIVERCASTMAAVMPYNRVSQTQRSGCARVSSYSKSWGTLLPQHGPGKKHTRRIQLADWQRTVTHAQPQLFLEGLIHSDGTRGINHTRSGGVLRGYPRYQFSNRSEDIKQLFCEHCDLLGIEWRVMNRQTISVARRESVRLLDEFVMRKA